MSRKTDCDSAQGLDLPIISHVNSKIHVTKGYLAPTKVKKIELDCLFSYSAKDKHLQLKNLC